MEQQGERTVAGMERSECNHGAGGAGNDLLQKVVLIHSRAVINAQIVNRGLADESSGDRNHRVNLSGEDDQCVLTVVAVSLSLIQVLIECLLK